jgi:hypothetical protein
MVSFGAVSRLSRTGHELAKFSARPETCFALALALFALLAWRRVDTEK